MGRPPVRSRRQLIDGIRFRLRTGVWRDVPVEYGPWGRVHDLFRRWQRGGAWRRILTRLQSLADAEGAIVHQAAPGRRTGSGARGDRGDRRPVRGIRRSSNPCWRRSACLASGRVGHASVRIACGLTRRTPPGRAASTCVGGGSAARS
ncbi:transposase [Streptomyces sp. NPDC058718]|uniref:transposase n=1 Tax=Streptomyces sp. NPDC058718 TaxID=3346610 RepID=UPI00367D4BEE